MEGGDGRETFKYSKKGGEIGLKETMEEMG
jgi:hypothetical protein